MKLSKTHKQKRDRSIRHRLLFSDTKTQEAEVRPTLWLAAAGDLHPITRSQFPVAVFIRSVPAASPSPVQVSTVDPSSLSWRSPEHGHSSEPRVVNCHQSFTVLWTCGQKGCPEDEEDGGESVRGVRWASRPGDRSSVLSELSVLSDPDTIKLLSRCWRGCCTRAGFVAELDRLPVCWHQTPFRNDSTLHVWV